MIPIAIEPTRLAYGLYCTAKGCTPADSREFHVFLQRLRVLFQMLSRHKLGIAITSELRSEYLRQIPYAEYSAADHGLLKIAHELYYRRFHEHLRVVHEYGQHSLEVVITSGVHDPRQLLGNDDTYLHWLDLVGLMLLDRIPRFIYSDDEASVFTEDFCTVETELPGTSVLVHVCADLDSGRPIQALAIWQLAVLIKNSAASPPEVVPCRGTGTHSSMWGCKIQSLDDVPEMERSLLSAIASTGLVEEFSFLDFPRRCSAVASPVIESLEVQHGNVLTGLLRGNGRRQHAQRIAVYLRPNCAGLLKSAMGDQIDKPRLERLKAIARYLGSASSKPSKMSAY